MKKDFLKPLLFVFIIFSICSIIYSFKSDTNNVRNTRIYSDYDKLGLKGRIRKLIETDTSAYPTTDICLFDTNGQITYHINMHANIHTIDTIFQYWYTYENQ